MNWEELIEQLRTPEAYSRFDACQDALSYVSSHILKTQQAADLLNTTAGLLQESNQKIPQFALEILTKAVNKSRRGFECYTAQLVEQAKQKLGDPKPQIKAAAIDLVFAIVNICGSEEVFSKLETLISSRNYKSRLSVVQIVKRAAETQDFSPQEFVKSDNKKGSQLQMLQVVVEYLSDPYPSVRDEAMATLVELYKRYGEVIQDYVSSVNIRQAILRDVLCKFEKCRNSEDSIQQDDVYSNDEN